MPETTPKNQTAAQSAPPAPIPHGSMIKVRLQDLAEGQFIRDVDHAIHAAYQAIEKIKSDRGVIPGDAKVSIELKIGFDPDAPDMVAIVAGLKTSLPAVSTATLAKSKAGQLLCQPTGTSDGDPDQMVLFAPDGRRIGKFDAVRGYTPNGQAAPESDVVGRIIDAKG